MFEWIFDGFYGLVPKAINFPATRLMSFTKTCEVDDMKIPTVFGQRLQSFVERIGPAKAGRYIHPLIFF